MRFRVILMLVGLSSLAAQTAQAASWLYWVENDNGAVMRRAELNGSNPQTVADVGGNGQFAAGIAFDKVAGKVYWIDDNTVDIKRSDLDGGNPEVIHAGPNQVLSLALVLPQASTVPAVNGVGLVMMALALAGAGLVALRTLRTTRVAT